MQVTIVLDGYSAPLSAGNFAALVVAGRLDGVSLRQTNDSVLVSAAPGGTPPLPLEILARGEFEPRYRAPLELTSGELPVLPLSIYGSVALAHGPGGPGTSAPNDFFIYEFDRQQGGGLGGLSFEEGEYAVVGYVTGGRELLPQVATGDVIARARLVSGQDRLVVPIAAAAATFIQPDSLFLGDR